MKGGGVVNINLNHVDFIVFLSLNFNAIGFIKRLQKSGYYLLAFAPDV